MSRVAGAGAVGEEGAGVRLVGGIAVAGELPAPQTSRATQPHRPSRIGRRDVRGGSRAGSENLARDERAMASDVTARSSH